MLRERLQEGAIAGAGLELVKLPGVHPSHCLGLCYQRGSIAPWAWVRFFPVAGHDELDGEFSVSASPDGLLSLPWRLEEFAENRWCRLRGFLDPPDNEPWILRRDASMIEWMALGGKVEEPLEGKGDESVATALGRGVPDGITATGVAEPDSFAAARRKFSA